jgi:rhodanese-related sulfurtransferase
LSQGSTLRGDAERKRDGFIPGSIQAPYHNLDRFVKPGGVLREMTASTGKRLIFYCAFGERSAMAVQTSHEMGLRNACHLVGGMDAWAKGGGTIER